MGGDIQMLGADAGTTAAVDAFVNGVFGGVHFITVYDLRYCSENSGVVEKPDKTGDRQFLRTLRLAISAGSAGDHGVFIQKCQKLFQSAGFIGIQWTEIFHCRGVVLHLFHRGHAAQNGL